MANPGEVAKLCEAIRKDYSPCDVSDALLKLHVPLAGHLKDISPIPSRAQGRNRLVAPISTVLFVPRTQQVGFPIWTQAPQESNIPKGKHWTDCPAPGTVAIFQQPPHQTVALLGNIVATRLKVRGVKGAVIDGRARDVVSCGEICADGNFQVWSKALSSVGTSMEAKPWAVDVPITVSDVQVYPGDVLVADEGEGVIAVIPQEKLQEIAELLPTLKEADDGLLKDVRNGTDFATALKNHPKHYSNH